MSNPDELRIGMTITDPSRPLPSTDSDVRVTGEPSPGLAFSRITKRDGRSATFDLDKIASAIQKAGEATGEFGAAIARSLALRVFSLAQIALAEPEPAVEQIQDLVEEVLLASPFKKTAKAYILYRDQHARIREMAAQADVELMESYLKRLDWRVHENSNMAYSLQGLNNYVASEVTKTYWLNHIYTPDVREAHLSGDLHLHDLGLLSVYCVGWDLQDLLRQGFRGAPGKAESGPARHFRTALGQVVNFFYTLQGEAAGAQAFSNLDTLLAPFIRADKLGYREVRQALQEFVFNLNVPTRVGFQTPFTNVTLDLRVPSTLRDEPAVVGGVEIEATYGDFQAEMDLFNRAFLEVMAEGDAKGRVFSFPIPTVNIDRDFPWEDPALEPLWRVTARYGIPYFANFVNSDLSPEDARSMCCRLRLDLRDLQHRGGGLFGANPLTGSIGVVTLNLPRVGYLATDEADFLARIDRLLEIARTSLETKRKVLEVLTDKDLYPYTKHYLRAIKARSGKWWTHHFSTVGLVGMNEAGQNLLGRDIGTPEGRAFALRVLGYMRQRLAAFQEQTGHHYNLEATPAEGAGTRLAKLDAARYADIRTAADYAAHSLDKRPKPFYTNSTQLPVTFGDDVFAVLEHQDDLQAQYTGGTVQHVYIGEAVSDPAAVKAFVRAVCQGFRLPYFTLSPTFSVCPEHGYQKGGAPACPTCGAKTEVYSRVVGYLRPIDQWNEGKQEEFAARTLFRMPIAPEVRASVEGLA